MASAGIGASVEGIHAVAAALAAGRITSLTVERARLDHPGVAGVVESARAAGIPVGLVDGLEGLAATSAPQGLVASARPIPTLSLEEAIGAVTPAALMVLDHVEDPHNAGAVARSALAAGFGALVVSARRAAPLGATAFKAAAGALDRLAVCTVSSIAGAVARLSALGVWTVGLTAGAERSLFGLTLLAEPVAVVVGAEGRGLARLVGERCDVLAAIPLAPGVESLNTSVAAALAAFETMRVRASAATGA